MIIAHIKPIEEIMKMIAGHKKILLAGCAGCTAVCMAGGQREVDELAIRLRSETSGVDIKRYTVERQCERDFTEELEPFVQKSDAVLSMACGAGVQFVAARYPRLPVFPALNTLFTGVNRDLGWYEENCRSCGDCQLAWTGGICPVTRCAKSIFNGPCGGSEKGMCEVNSSADCAWCAIYERLKAQGRLDDILSVREPMIWKNQVPRTLVLERFAAKRRNS